MARAGVGPVIPDRVSPPPKTPPPMFSPPPPPPPSLPLPSSPPGEGGGGEGGGWEGGRHCQDAARSRRAARPRVEARDERVPAAWRHVHRPRRPGAVAVVHRLSQGLRHHRRASPGQARRRRWRPL